MGCLAAAILREPSQRRRVEMDVQQTSAKQLGLGWAGCWRLSSLRGEERRRAALARASLES